ncbi:hypothetical protein Taro_000467, partial [Colocasia esculenta]|nr:hypothetical protein [Colocasia esculenta]
SERLCVFGSLWGRSFLPHCSGGGWLVLFCGDSGVLGMEMVSQDLATGQAQKKLSFAQGIFASLCPAKVALVPSLCKFCNRIGHQEESCFKKNKNTMSKKSDAPTAPVPTISANEWKPVCGRKPTMVVAFEVPVINAFKRLREDVPEVPVINQNTVIPQQAEPVVEGDVQALGSQAGPNQLLESSMPSSSLLFERSNLPLSSSSDQDSMLYDINAIQAQGSVMGGSGYETSNGVHLSLGSKDVNLRVHGAELVYVEGPCRNGDGATISSSPTVPALVAGDVDDEGNHLLVHVTTMTWSF